MEEESIQTGKMKQTAVDWLIEEVELISNSKKVSRIEIIELYNQAIKQAKEMEKEQIMFAYGDGQQNGREFQEAFNNGDGYNVITSEKYYKKTYNDNK